MSIVRQLLRTAAVEAWRGRTAALGNVFDSKIDTISGLLTGVPAPVLIFSIEEEEGRAAGQTNGFLGRDAVLTGMVQAAVASGKEVRDGEGTVIVPVLGETDAAFEALLDIVSYQWRLVLHDDENEWSRLFRDLIIKIGTIKDVRATDPETGTKHASRFWQFEIEVLAEPVPGDELQEVIERGLSLLEADGEYTALATSWRQMLAQGAGLPDWKALQSSLFASRADMAAIGQGPGGIDEMVDFTRAVIAVSGVEAQVISDDP